MSVYRFKITFEEFDDVVREVEIRSDQTFADLHHIILNSIQFDNVHEASFFMSNDRWTKEQEISLHAKPPKNGMRVILMKDALLRDFINDPHQKIYYVYDYKAQWTFFVELLRIFPLDDIRLRYPVCVKIKGDVPKQYEAMPLPKGVKDSDSGTEELVVDDYSSLESEEGESDSFDSSDEDTEGLDKNSEDAEGHAEINQDDEEV